MLSTILHIVGAILIFDLGFAAGAAWVGIFRSGRR